MRFNANLYPESIAKLEKIKYGFKDKMDLRLFYFHVTKYKLHYPTKIPLHENSNNENSKNFDCNNKTDRVKN